MRLKRETQGAFCKRKITNAKIYEDKRDLYCIAIPYIHSEEESP